MKKHSLIYVSIILLIVLLFTGCIQPPSTPPESPYYWFDKLDRNNDERISRLEAFFNRHFNFYDLNDDGYIDLVEWINYLNYQAFLALDTNHDGKISWEEYLVLDGMYERYYAIKKAGAQPPKGVTLPNPYPEKIDPLGLTFAQDFTPGATDPQGLYLQARETAVLIGHQGMLFASFGARWREPNPNFQANGIWRKESPTGPWIVDYQLPPYLFRVECMFSMNFTTDATANPFTSSISTLVAAIWSSSEKQIHIRNDTVGAWGIYPVTGGRELQTGETFSIRSFGSHIDKVTGVHSLYAGAWFGSWGNVGAFDAMVLRASYDSTVEGGLIWAPQAELTGVGRIMGFAECNGDLYVSCGIKDDTSLSGGVFRRIDGTNPSWELVYRFPEYNLGVWDDEQRIMRGITAVPDPNNPNKEVLIGFRFFPSPKIERIDPQQNHKVTVELEMRTFFGKAFFGEGQYYGAMRAAYNGFTEYRNPVTNETVYLTGMQIYHPLFPEPAHSGSFYLVRFQNGSYDWGEIVDPVHPVRANTSLDATRRICVSPFAEDNGQVLYFGGYDGAFVDNLTAWIYKGTFLKNMGEKQ